MAGIITTVIIIGASTAFTAGARLFIPVGAGDTRTSSPVTLTIPTTTVRSLILIPELRSLL